MYRYDISSGGYEGASRVTLVHKLKFSNEELFKLFRNQLVIAAERMGNTEPLANVWVSTMDKFFEPVVDLLIEYYGFSKEVYAAELHVFGWRHLDSNSFDEDPKTNELVAAFEEQGMTQDFFQTWQALMDDYVHDENVAAYEARLFGASAGGAFRLNEMLNRRAFTRVVTRAEWEAVYAAKHVAALRGDRPETA